MLGSRLALLALTALILTLFACSEQPGEGEPCDESFEGYCCSDKSFCLCEDGVVDKFNCDQFCENIGYDYGGECGGQTPGYEDDPFYFCHCD